MYSIIRCKRCRQLIFDDTESYELFMNPHWGHLNEESDKENCPSLGSLICLAEEKLPAWIKSVINETNWSKGKINCKNCSARIGTFDFISGTKCVCRSYVIPPVHLIKSKVDAVTSV